MQDSGQLPPSGPELLGAGLEVWHMMVESQMVVAMRVLGMAGVWAVKPDENFRMVGEKYAGFTDAALAAQSSAWRGERPDQVMIAAVRPLRARTYANTRRLTRNGSRDFSSLLPVQSWDKLPMLPMQPFYVLLMIWRKGQDVVRSAAMLVSDNSVTPLLPAPAPVLAIGNVIEGTARDLTPESAAPTQVIAPPAPRTAAQTLAPEEPARPGLGGRLRRLFGRRDTM